MSVAEMERRFYELKGKLDVGAITEEEFKTEVEKLRFQDAQNRWWMIGAQSGKWYMYSGARWIPGQPPSTSPASSPPPPETAAPVQPPLATELPRPENKPAPQVPPAQTEPVLPPAPIAREPSPHPQPEAAVQASPLRFAVPGPLLVGCAALLAVIGLAVFCIAADNLIPSRPLTSLIGNQSAASSTPTRVASAVSLPGSNVTQLLNAGDEFLLRSLFDAAVAQYQSAAQLAPSNPTPLTRWSRAQALRGNLQDAIAKAQQATQRAPNDAEAQAQWARALAWNGQGSEALPIAEKAVQLDGKSANAHATLAEIYLAVNRPSDAQTQAQLALQLAPQNAEAHRAVAWVLTLTGQKEAASAEWRQTVALEPDLFFRHYEWAEVNRAYFGNAAGAVPEYVRAIGLYGAYTPLYSRLGLAFLNLNQPQSAMEQFQKAIALDPNNDDGYAYLGMAYGMTNQCLQGIPYLEYALRLNANNGIAAKGLNDCRGGQAPTLLPSPPPRIPLVPPTVAPAAAAAPVEAPAPPATSAPPSPSIRNTPAAPSPGAYPYPSGRIIFPLYDANAKTLALFQASAADGGGRMLVADNASSASVRSDGALLLFTNWAPGQRGVWVMQPDGSNRYALTEGGEQILPSFSPDGSAFVFAARGRQGELSGRSMRIMVGNTSKLNRDADLRVLGEGQSPTWGPNNRIAFKPCGAGGCGLALMGPDGSGVATLAQFDDTTVPAWSPDGTKIAIGARTGGEASNLFLIDVARGSALQLTNQLATDGPAAFSPDGKSLAFLSSRGNRWGIWTMNTDGSNLRKVFDLGGAPGASAQQEPPVPLGQSWWDQRIVWVK